MSLGGGVSVGGKMAGLGRNVGLARSRRPGVVEASSPCRTATTRAAPGFAPAAP